MGVVKKPNLLKWNKTLMGHNCCPYLVHKHPLIIKRKSIFSTYKDLFTCALISFNKRYRHLNTIVQNKLNNFISVIFLLKKITQDLNHNGSKRAAAISFLNLQQNIYN